MRHDKISRCSLYESIIRKNPYAYTYLILHFPAVRQSVKRGVFNPQNKAGVLHNCNASRASLTISYRYLEIGEFAVHT